MELASHLKTPLKPLCYTGFDLHRDAFELYVRLVYHFEFVVHSICAHQWGLDVGYDPFPTQLEQVSKFVLGLAKNRNQRRNAVFFWKSRIGIGQNDRFRRFLPMVFMGWLQATPPGF